MAGPEFGDESVLIPVARIGLRRIFKRKITGKGETCQDHVSVGIDGQSVLPVGAVIGCPAEVGGVA